MTGQFGQAAEALAVAAERAEKVIHLLNAAQEALTDARGGAETVYAGVRAGDELLALGAQLAEGTAILAEGATRYVRALYEAANRASQGYS